MTPPKKPPQTVVRPIIITRVRTNDGMAKDSGIRNDSQEIGKELRASQEKRPLVVASTLPDPMVAPPTKK